MKLKKTLIFSSIITVFLLAGCATAEPTNQNLEQQPASNGTVTNGSQPSPGQIDESQLARPVVTPEVKYTEEDLAFYAGATQLKDASYCEKISNAELMQKCKTDIQDQEVFDQAVAASDPTVCETLTGTKIDLCKMQLAEAKQMNDNMRPITDAENEIMTRAEQSLDVTICDEITSDSKKENCVNNVNLLLQQKQQ